MNLTPFQAQLKESTKEAHSKAEQHPLMQSMINGTVSKEHLLQFLVNLYPIYSVVEQRLLFNDIKNNSELRRTERIEKDINTLIKEIINVKNLHLLTPLPCTCAWVSNCWKKPVELLKAELYCRWLADLYGGKMLAKTVVPSEMYVCENAQETIALVRSLVEVANNSAQEEIIQEALSFFDFHVELFDDIYNGNT